MISYANKKEMKYIKILLIITSFFLSCIKVNAQEVKTDSARIVEKLNRLEELTKETQQLIQRADMIEKKKETLIQKLKVYITTLTNSVEKVDGITLNSRYKNNKEAIKSENNLKPVTEIDVPSGVDTIKGGRIYRILHKNDYYFRPYKLVNGRKVYL